MYDEESEEEERPEEDEVDEDIPLAECPAGIDPLAWSAWRLDVIDQRACRLVELWGSEDLTSSERGFQVFLFASSPSAAALLPLPLERLLY